MMPIKKIKEDPTLLIIGLLFGGAGVGGGSYFLNGAPPKNEIREAVVQLKTIGLELGHMREDMRRDRDEAESRSVVMTEALAKVTDTANNNRADIRALQSDVDSLKADRRSNRD